MELGNQIKAHRAVLSLSQEELAEKVYVTRQTVSNWETGKSYPDIHSLLLLSALFDVSLDQLIKGDLETMKQEVNAADVRAMNRDGIIYTILLAATIILPVPSNQVVRPVRPHSGAFALGQRDVLCPPPRAHQKSK